MRTEMIIEEYRQGDADKRMSLFLYYRDLRDAFIRIEQSDPADIFEGSPILLPATESMVRRFLAVLRTRCSPYRSRPTRGGGGAA